MNSKRTAFFVFIIIAVFMTSGCCTAMYENEVVYPAQKKYWQSPFNVDSEIGENLDGHYIGLETFKNADYKAFVFKNLIKTEEDNYIKILLPVKTGKNQNPQEIIITDCGEADFDEKKMISPVTIYVPDENSKNILVISTFQIEQSGQNKFAFLLPAKDVLSFYKKKRLFPTYIFYYLGFPVTISTDVITLPLQVLMILFVAHYLG